MEPTKAIIGVSRDHNESTYELSHQEALYLLEALEIGNLSPSELKRLSDLFSGVSAGPLQHEANLIASIDNALLKYLSAVAGHPAYDDCVLVRSISSFLENSQSIIWTYYDERRPEARCYYAMQNDSVS